MKLQGVHHVSLNVANAEIAQRFYLDVLGLELLDRPDFGFPGTWLGLPDGRQVHLIEVADWTGPKGQHFAFQVSDLDAVRAELTEKGLKVSEPFSIPGVGRQSFLKDPCGNLLELNEPVLVS